MPGRFRGRRQTKFFRERPGKRNSLIAQGCQRATGPTKLHDRRSIEACAQTMSSAPDCTQPARGFQAEGHGRRWLQEGPPEHNAVFVLLHQMGESFFQPSEVIVEQWLRPLEQQRHCRVRDILAGGPPMNEARRFSIAPSHLLGKSLYQWNRWRAGTQRCLSERRRIEVFALCCRCDRIGGSLWNDAQAGFGTSKCNLELQHGREDRIVGKQFRKWFRGCQTVDQSHRQCSLLAGVDAGLRLWLQGWRVIPG